MISKCTHSILDISAHYICKIDWEYGNSIVIAVLILNITINE